MSSRNIAKTQHLFGELSLKNNKVINRILSIDGVTEETNYGSFPNAIQLPLAG